MPIVRWHHRLDVRVLVGLLCLLTVSAVLLFYYLHQWQNQTIRNQAQAQSEAVAHTMVASLKTLMLAGDAESVRDWFARLRSHAELKSVEVLRRDGMIAFRDVATMHQVNRFLGASNFSRKALDSQPVEGIKTEDIARAAGGTMVVKRDTEHQQLTLLLPIKAEKSCLVCHGYEHNPVRGILRVTTSTANAMNAIRQADQHLLILIVVGALLLLSTVFLLLHSSILRPIARLFQATRDLALGGIGTEVPVTGQGELRMLMESFNAMSIQLEQTTVSNDFMETVIHSLGEMLFVTDAEGTIQISNQQACNILGYSMEQFHGRNILSLFDHAINLSPSQQDTENTMRGSNGDSIQVAISTRCIPAQTGGDHEHLIHVLRDLRQQKESERKLRLAAKVINTVPSAIMVTDKDANLCMLNPSFSKITGYGEDEVLGKNPRFLSSGCHSKAFYDAMWHGIQEKDHWTGEIWNKRKDGGIYPESLSINVMRDKEGEISYYVGTFLDISIQKKLEDNLRHSAHHDALTGLPNRALLSDRLNESFSRGRRLKHPVGILFIDIDEFKPVNDQMGHDAGDLLLQEISDRLRDCVRETDTVARVGGDEFVIALENLSGNLSQKTVFLSVAKKILCAIQQPFSLPAGECLVGASIGISVFPDDSRSQEELLKQADSAMYVAKEGGKNRAVFYQASMDAEL